MLRDFAKANQTIDRAIAANPTALGPWEVKSKLAISENGDFSVAERAFEAVKSFPMTNEQKLKIASGRADVFLLERKYSEGLQQAESLPDDQLAAYPKHLLAKYYCIGSARKSLHDDSGARVAFLKAKSIAEENLKRSSDSEDAHLDLAKVLAQLGEKELALQEAQRATELVPERRDAFSGPEIASGVAEVYAILGDKDRAIEILNELLTRPSGVTAQGLKVNPIWDPLRSDPRFQALIDKYGAKA
jgi:adenylate cyclase